MISSAKTLLTRPLWRTVALRSTPLAAAAPALEKLRLVPHTTLANDECRRDYAWIEPYCKRYVSYPGDLVLASLPVSPTSPLSFNSSPSWPSPVALRNKNPPIPTYLKEAYWWAYIHPSCIRALDHKFLVNIVLWGNFEILRDAVIEELCHDDNDDSYIRGKTLQVSCVYANLTERLVQRMAPTASLDVIDVVPAQLENLQRKLQRRSLLMKDATVTLSCRDAQDLAGFDDNATDQVLLFFLLHEMPNEVRIKALKEAGRVVKPGGKLVILDYHRPSSQFWQTVMTAMYQLYEPYAMDMWTHDVRDWLPPGFSQVSKELFFGGGLYQKLVFTKS